MTQYLAQLDKTKGRHEDSRLLYVAATRARRRLVLLGHAGILEKQDGEQELKLPPRQSLLARLWPVVADEYQALLGPQEPKPPAPVALMTPAVPPAVRSRLSADWSLPAPPGSVRTGDRATDDTGIELLVFDWAGETARQVGTVVHRLLQHWGKMGIEDIGPEALRRGRQLGRKLLAGLGVPGDHLEAASAAIATALQNMLENGRDRWILSKRHTGARCELALSGVREGAVEHVIIDRSFVDEHGTRWIIDYKTGAHGGGLDEFLDRE